MKMRINKKINMASNHNRRIVVAALTSQVTTLTSHCLLKLQLETFPIDVPPDILSFRSDFLRHITREGFVIQTSVIRSHCQRMAGQLAQEKKHLRNFETKLNFGNVKWNPIKWSVLTLQAQMGSNPSRTRELAHDFALN